jgi:hypothetical protein
VARGASDLGGLQVELRGLRPNSAVAAAIASDSQGREIPVVIEEAAGQGSSRNRCADMGAEAPGWQGATAAHSGAMRGRSNAASRAVSATRLAQSFRDEPLVP